MTKVRARRPRLRVDPSPYRRLHQQVLERDGWRCQQCGNLGNLHVHHITFRSQLGQDAEHNLITLCAKCHEEAHQKRIMVKRKSNRERVLKNL